MSSTFQRARSLRKPTLSTTDSRAPARNKPPSESRRDVSPSRLPVKPLTRSATISGGVSSSTTDGSSNAVSGSRTIRPAGASISRSTSLRQAATTTTSTAYDSPTRRETSTTSGRYPPSAVTTRTTRSTASRPSSAEGPSSTLQRKGAIHTRAKSTATGLSSAVLRTSPRDSISSIAATVGPSSSTSTISSRGSTTTRRPSVQQQNQQPEKPATSQTTQPRLRPTFNTLQQHYSPAKTSAPKTLTSAILAPPSPSKLPANIAASAETNKLQTELLQLHLLHRDASVVDAEWRASAKQKFGERFAKIAAQGREVDECERAEVERENALALRRWAASGGLEERIQALDEVVGGLWALSEHGGKYARTVKKFERWVDKMCDIEEGRQDGGRFLQEQQVIFIGELDSSWKDDVPALLRHLEGWKRQLEDIGHVPPAGEGEVESSSLHKMIEYSRTMTQDMLSELAAMEEIERQALAKEDEWIETMNTDEADDTPSAGAIWRTI